MEDKKVTEETELQTTGETQEAVPVEGSISSENVDDSPSSKPEEKPQARNFKALRKEKERVTRERDEIFQELQAIKSKSTAEDSSKEEEVQLAPDDLVEWRHVESKIKKLENQIETYHHQTNLSSTETKLKQQYPDFDSVVSKENVESLRIAYPELAKTLNTSTDLYSTAVSAYTLIKKFGIHQADTFKNEKERAQTNSLKPKPLASVSPQQGDSPLSNANAFANGLTDELKAQLYKEMLEARKAV